MEEVELKKCKKCNGKIRFEMTDTIKIEGYLTKDGLEHDIELGERGEGMNRFFDTNYIEYCEDCGEKLEG